MNGRRVFLTLWLATPVVAVALLCVWIVASLRAGPKMVAPPVGAGAGDTGGANAIGDWLADRRASGRVRVLVEDRAGAASDAEPLLLACRASGWEGRAMSRVGEGRWEWTGPPGDLDEGFEILWQGSEGGVRRDAAGRRRVHVSSGEQTVVVERLIP